ncbi:SubName: Full=Uncharacterized protein {ECO:0000313/EMBL:CCA71716.1} [Serendipita indica DSM 11827]|uniref:Uncharacterized protein n=1 Tax=Serendipita indica (strain DSM 11827) TaxID=1109443 RepID=G4TK73_SERID|nr:SubName: Full=Uncharacterized protein {ECO:0000313/EMBL:CCA71716.1} [Serendipita indica DSM 11827]CCA71716.1 hypothetical protein PIIN_05651 [Serendipita indica DSM 11827]
MSEKPLTSQSSQDPNVEPVQEGTSPISPQPNTPPFTAYLQIVSFIATITISVSISGSQAFATGDIFFGTSLDGSSTDPASIRALQLTKTSAEWFAWAAATSALSLMITLVLQLLLTDEVFVRQITAGKGIPRMMLAIGSWVALALQASSMALIAEAVKSLNKPSGAMMQWCLLAIGFPSFLLYMYILRKDRKRRDGVPHVP